MPHHYGKFIVQSLIGPTKEALKAKDVNKYSQCGTIPDTKGMSFAVVRSAKL